MNWDCQSGGLLTSIGLYWYFAVITFYISVIKSLIDSVSNNMFPVKSTSRSFCTEDSCSVDCTSKTENSLYNRWAEQPLAALMWNSEREINSLQSQWGLWHIKVNYAIVLFQRTSCICLFHVTNGMYCVNSWHLPEKAQTLIKNIPTGIHICVAQKNKNNT